MIFSIETFRTIFNEYLTRKTTNDRKDCPSLDTLIYSMNHKSSRRLKLKISDHIGDCYQCKNIFLYMISLQKEQEYLLYKYFSPLYPLHRKRISTKQRLICFFSGRLNNISLSQQTLIIAFAFVITICSFFVLTKNKYNEQNRAYYEYFDVIRPTSTIPISSEISFEWSIINDSSYFIVELLDESLILLWRSPKILETSVKLPNEVFSKLRQDNSYYWFVTVVLKDGEKIESNVAEFKISNIK